MDFRGRRHERGSNWTDPEIVELLQLWSDESVQIELESSLRNQRVFDRIANILREKGIYRTGDQCREKIKKMKLEYRRIKDNHKLRSWKFYDVMDRVLANRPAITYSSLGGAVVAQQVFQSPCGPETYTQGAPASSFGPASTGGFLFGHPSKSTELLDIKCEDVEDKILNSGVTAPEMYYGSGDDQETDGQSVLEPEDTLGQVEGSANARISPPGFIDLNMASSAAATKTGSGLVQQETVRQASKEDAHPPTPVRQRKRRRGGRVSRACRGARLCSQRGLDKALASFLSWQQSAEERLLSLEEARLEKEVQMEERREQQEERRVEQERQHELRLLSVFAGALATVKQGAPPSVEGPSDSSVSALTSLAASLMTTNVPSTSSSLSQPTHKAPGRQAPLNAETLQATPTSPNKSCESGENGLGKLRDTGISGHSVYLSSRGNSIRQHQGILQEGYARYHADKHHDTDNPDGIINMGTSENKLCYDLLHKRMTQPDMLHIEPSLLEYGDWKGHNFLRKEVASFLSHYCGSQSPLAADNIVVMNGCGSLFSSVAAVICDPGDAILIPTPFYGVITEDVHLYSGVKLFHVPLDCKASDKDSRPFHLTVAKLEEAIRRAKREGVVIRAVILVNPHNPLADIYTPQEMTDFLEFANRHELHAIVDEVYMLTVFDESLTFHSVLSFDSLPNPQRTHVLWGISKDFAMAGVRIGTLYTENRDVVEALEQLASFHGVSGPVQHQVAQLFRDRDWISKEFLPENRRRLQAAHSCLTGELQSMGIHYLHRSAGFYVWADLRKYLRDSSFTEERSLCRRFLRHKVLLRCGQAFSCSTPGWFRIVFTNQPHHLQLGIARIRKALKETEEEIASPASGFIGVTSEGKQKAVKRDSGESDNAVIVNSTSCPQSKSSDQLKVQGSPALDPTPLANDEFALVDCQSSTPSDSLDSLISTLKQQIRSSDWLEKNTPELTAGEDPELLDVFTDLLQRARD